MPVNVPSFQTFDLARAVQSGQQIKQNRLRNQLLGQETQAEMNVMNVMQNRQKAAAIRQHFESLPRNIKTYEQEAQVLARAGLLDQAQSARAQADKLRDSYVQTKLNSVKLLSTLRDSINASNYKELRQNLIQHGAIDGSMMPTEYSDDWFRKKIGEAKGDIKVVTQHYGQGGKEMARDVTFQNGQVLQRGAPYETPASATARREAAAQSASADASKAKANKPFDMQASDTNAIGRSVATLYGGVFNPVTGAITALDPKTAAKALSVAEEASRIYRDHAGALSHDEAVAAAAREQGIDVRNLHQAHALNPLNLELTP